MPRLRWSRLIWLLVAAVGVWALVRNFGIDGATPIAFLMAFTPQVAVAALVVARRLGIADYGTEALPGSDHRVIWATLFVRGS